MLCYYVASMRQKYTSIIVWRYGKATKPCANARQKRICSCFFTHFVRCVWFSKVEAYMLITVPIGSIGFFVRILFDFSVVAYESQHMDYNVSTQYHFNHHFGHTLQFLLYRFISNMECWDYADDSHIIASSPNRYC